MAMTLDGTTGIVLPSGAAPAFSISSAGLTLTTSTFTKVPFSIFNTNPAFGIDYDTNSNYDTANRRFRPSVAGYYFVMGRVFLSIANGGRGIVSVYKNGVDVAQTVSLGSASGGGISYSGQAVVYMNGTTDYVEIYALHEQGSDTTLNTNPTLTNFSGYMVRSA